MKLCIEGACKTEFVNWLIDCEEGPLLSEVVDLWPGVVEIEGGDAGYGSYLVHCHGDVFIHAAQIEFRGMRDRMYSELSFHCGVVNKQDTLVINVGTWLEKGDWIRWGGEEDKKGVTAMVCISTEWNRAVGTGDEREMRVLANPEFGGYSNAEEYITMQHVTANEGHPLMFNNWDQEMSPDIALWMERTEKAVRHTLKKE